MLASVPTISKVLTATSSLACAPKIAIIAMWPGRTRYWNKVFRKVVPKISESIETKAPIATAMAKRVFTSSLPLISIDLLTWGSRTSRAAAHLVFVSECLIIGLVENAALLI
jgi:hypothetical protein